MHRKPNQLLRPLGSWRMSSIRLASMMKCIHEFPDVASYSRGLPCFGIAVGLPVTLHLISFFETQFDPSCSIFRSPRLLLPLILPDCPSDQTPNHPQPRLSSTKNCAGGSANACASRLPLRAAPILDTLGIVLLRLPYQSKGFFPCPAATLNPCILPLLLYRAG